MGLFCHENSFENAFGKMAAILLMKIFKCIFCEEKFDIFVSNFKQAANDGC